MQNSSVIRVSENDIVVYLWKSRTSTFDSCLVSAIRGPSDCTCGGLCSFTISIGFNRFHSVPLSSLAGLKRK